MAHPNELAVSELVGKIGLAGLYQGLADHLADQSTMIDSSPDEDGELDPASLWLERLQMLAEMSLPYATAVSQGAMHLHERSDNGASIEVRVHQD
jgi:hypothetical protein